MATFKAPIPVRGFGGEKALAAVTRRMIIDEKADKSKSGKPVLGSFKKGVKKSNQIRLKHSKKIKPSKKSIDNYKMVLSEAYAKALKMQLDTEARGSRNGIRTRFQNVGRASGKLMNSIKAVTTVKITHDENKGSYRIGYSIRHDISDAKGTNGKIYGDYLNYERPPHNVGAYAILKWMKQKISLGGGLKIYNRLKKANPDGVNKNKALLRIAFAINGSLKKEARSAVLKDWYVFDKNKKLRDDFNRLSKSKGAYRRKLIRKSLMENLTK